MDLFDVIAFLVQVAVGILVIFIIYGVAVYVMNTDGIASDQGIVQAIATRTTVLPGTIDASHWIPRVWNTVLPSGASTLPSLQIRKSVNRFGGAQFSYSFWLYVDNLQNIHQNTNNSQVNCNLGGQNPTASDGSTPILSVNNPDLYVLFVKGDNRCYQYSTASYDLASKKAGTSTGFQGRYVKAPLVAIGDPNLREMRVYYNSLSAVDNVVILSRNANTYDSTARRNVPSLTEGSWVMYTFVFMDYVPINDFETGIVVKSYVNDTLYQIDKSTGSLKDNDGELTVLPDGPPGTDSSYSTPGTKLLLSTMDYYNYALSDQQVASRFRAGVNQNPNPDVTANNDLPVLNLSAYNKLDVYNL